MADEEMAEEYDSREDTEKHIKRVGEYLTNYWRKITLPTRNEHDRKY